MGKLDGITAIITGAATGQGATEAELFVAEGSHVIIADVKDEEGQQLAKELGDQARYVHLDVGSADEWAHLIEGLNSPPLRVLVNNAAIHWSRPIEFEEADDVMMMWRVNLLGPLLGMRAVLPIMRSEGGGSIINISSTGGLTGIPYMGAYTASKWGLRGLSKTAATEFGAYGIRVNSVHPGPIESPMMLDSPTYVHGGPDRYAHLPLGRAGHKSEVAHLVLYLASEESGFVTGSEIAVDGGMLAGRPPTYEWTPRDRR